MALLTKTGYLGLTLLTEHLSRSGVIDRTLVIGPDVLIEHWLSGMASLTEHWLSGY